MLSKKRIWIIVASLLAGLGLRSYLTENRTSAEEAPSIELHANVWKESHYLNQEPTLDESSAFGITEHNSDKHSISKELTDLFQAGLYEQALNFAEKHADDDEIPESIRAWLIKQIPNIITSLGWQKYQETDYFSAISWFEKALAIHNEPLAIKGLAGSYFQLKYLWQAEHYSRLFLQHQPKDFDTSLLLIETLESTQNLPEAIEVIDQLLQSNQLGLEQKRFTEKKSQTIRARLQESRHQITINSPHFALTYRPVEHESIAQWLLDLLESTLDEFRFDWGFEEPKAPIEIIIYPAQNFSSMIHGPEWAQAIYDGRIRIPIDHKQKLDLTNFQRIVRHEMVHALTAQQTGHRPLPPWFSEGIAQYLECQGGCLDHGNMMSGNFLSLELFQQSFLSLPRDKARRAYGQSLFMIQTLVHIKGGSAIPKTLESLSPSSVLDSNQILRSVDIQFKNLYSNALSTWQKGKL
ncbi:MAG: peptidase MA family metallohydrolase [Oligoflexus sp.]